MGCCASRVKLPNIPDPNISLQADRNMQGIILPQYMEMKANSESTSYSSEEYIRCQLTDVPVQYLERFCKIHSISFDSKKIPETIDLLAKKLAKLPNCGETHRKSAELTSNLLCDGKAICTAYECLIHGVGRNKTGRGFATRPWKLTPDRRNVVMHPRINEPEREMRYVYQSYSDDIEIEEKSRYIGLALLAIGNHRHATIGLYSINRAEFQISAFAAFSQSMIVVPIYDTLGIDSVKYILHHSETNTVFVSKDKLVTLEQAISTARNIKNIVQFDFEPRFQNIGEKVDADTRARFDALGVHLYGFSELIEMGSKILSGAPQPPEPKDVAYIMYTSGTTGTPKGVVITHGMFMAEIGAIGNGIIEPHWVINDQDSMLSYLPLAHIFECMAEIYCLCLGVTLCYYQGNVKLLTDDLALSHPTIFCGVPRVYQRFYDKVLATINDGSSIVKGLFNMAMESVSESRLTGSYRNPLWDLLIFNKLRAKMGLDRCKVMFTGAAPMQPYIMHILQCMVNVPMLQGYGMTETTCGSNITLAEDINLAHVGPPLACTEIKLEDVLSMGYSHFDTEGPRGEVLFRGPNILSEYFKNPQATKSDITPDGWLHSGDIGRWNNNGTLSIIDRKKNMFKLLQGEYIAAEKLEASFTKSEYIGQLWIYGNSLKSFLLAVVVPNVERMVKLGQESHWKVPESVLATPEFSAEFYDMCSKHYDEIYSIIYNDMKRLAKVDKLQSFEVPKALILELRVDELLQGFNVKNNCLTPTFKLKRPQLLLKYVDTLKQKYSDLKEPDKPGEKWPGCK